MMLLPILPPSLSSPFDFSLFLATSSFYVILFQYNLVEDCFQPVTSPLLALLRLKVPFATTALNPVTSRVSFSLP